METRDRILIVDDDPEIRRLLVDYLAKNGFEALPARQPWVTAPRPLPQPITSPMRLRRIRPGSRQQKEVTTRGNEARPV